MVITIPWWSGSPCTLYSSIGLYGNEVWRASMPPVSADPCIEDSTNDTATMASWMVTFSRNISRAWAWDNLWTVVILFKSVRFWWWYVIPSTPLHLDFVHCVVLQKYRKVIQCFRECMFAYFDKKIRMYLLSWACSLECLCWIHTSFTNKRNQYDCSGKK